MKLRILLTLVAVGLIGCAAPPEEEGSTIQSSDNAGFIPGDGFNVDNDPLSKHKDYLGRGL